MNTFFLFTNINKENGVKGNSFIPCHILNPYKVEVFRRIALQKLSVTMHTTARNVYDFPHHQRRLEIQSLLPERGGHKGQKRRHLNAFLKHRDQP